eukprot:NODE_5685_length_1744_cov_4.337044.p1 GENE.NODE_5685_length_1744_cov_4.337044~~NODE_5685_length_1744_cov_4.337044.p1  ORF type:complete len:313 (-),score=16.83 NODE_5685_length_1744_cov_4.337044:452-1390(-)
MNRAVMDGRAVEAKESVQAFGVRTCAFVIVETTTGIVGWHASAWNMPGNPMESEMPEVLRVLRCIGGSFVRGFVVPGFDLDHDLHLRPDSASGQMCGGTSTNFLPTFLERVTAEFRWWPQLLRVAPVHCEADVVEYTLGAAFPVTFRNSTFKEYRHNAGAGVRPSLTTARVSSPPSVQAMQEGADLFAVSIASPGDVILDEYPVVFHDVPAGNRCEGCSSMETPVGCKHCAARFCSPACRERAWSLRHAVTCRCAIAGRFGFLRGGDSAARPRRKVGGRQRIMEGWYGCFQDGSLLDPRDAARAARVRAASG